MKKIILIACILIPAIALADVYFYGGRLKIAEDGTVSVETPGKAIKADKIVEQTPDAGIIIEAELKVQSIQGLTDGGAIELEDEIAASQGLKSNTIGLLFSGEQK